MPFSPYRIFPDPLLKQPAEPVTAVTQPVLQLMRDMRTLIRAEGLSGLSAPQLGHPIRLIAVKKPGGPDSEVVCMINPELSWPSPQKTATRIELCRSIPNRLFWMTRPRTVDVVYLDHEGVKREITGTGAFSRCIQHEVDHLNGLLLNDETTGIPLDYVLAGMTGGLMGAIVNVSMEICAYNGQPNLAEPLSNHGLDIATSTAFCSAFMAGIFVGAAKLGQLIKG